MLLYEIIKICGTLVFEIFEYRIYLKWNCENLKVDFEI